MMTTLTDSRVHVRSSREDDVSCRRQQWRRRHAVAGTNLHTSSVLLVGVTNVGILAPRLSSIPGKEGGEENESRRVNYNRRFYCEGRCTADRRPHARNSEQRLRRAGRFSPTATWPLPPLSQLERERRSQSLHTPPRVPTLYINMI